MARRGSFPAPPRLRSRRVGSGAGEIVVGILAAILAFVLWLIVTVICTAIPVIVILLCLSAFGVI